MKKMLLDYIREKDECNYLDIDDWLKDLSFSGNAYKVKIFLDLIFYILKEEEKEGNDNE